MLSFIILSLCIGSCKGRSSENTNSDTATTTTTTPADNTTKKNPDTVVISGDDSLRNMITDAVKDYPGVTATADQGVITLTGNITREKLPKLMMAMNSLHPKKIINNLTIK
jgi:predicted methyltransferase